MLALVLGVLSLTSVGVRCFAVGDDRSNAVKRHGLVNPPPSAFENSKNYRSVPTVSTTRLWEKKQDEGTGEARLDSQPDSSMNFTGAEPNNPMVPPIESTNKERQGSPGNWPCLDKLDKELIKISLPVIGNFAINPLIGAVDLFWVNRMGNPLAVAGQAAANQVFNSAFWFTSFLPSVTATLVSKQHAAGDKQGTQDAICQALFIGFFIAMIGTPLMFFNPDRALSAVLSGKIKGCRRESILLQSNPRNAHTSSNLGTAGAPAMEYARPYFLIRSFAFLPSLISLVGFSAFRGKSSTTHLVQYCDKTIDSYSSLIWPKGSSIRRRR